MTKVEQRQVIGIVGGLGPYAHLELERKLLEAARRLAGAGREQDFPSWVLSSLPATPDRTAALVDPRAPDPSPLLLESLRRLEAAGADFALIACNTAHCFLPHLREASCLPILDMIGATARHAARGWPGATIGVLATTGTLRTGLYQQALGSLGAKVVSLLDSPRGAHLQQELVMAAIYGGLGGRGSRDGGGIKARGVFAEAREALVRAARHLVAEAGVEVLVAGCTEISLAFGSGEVAGRPWIDPMTVVAEAAIRRAYGLDPGAGER